MTMDDIPIWLLFVVTTLLVVAAIEGGYQVGKKARRKSKDEKEAPVGAIVGTVLALLAFILAFTFGIVSDRYDARKALVREQASAIRTAYARSDFLPDQQRQEAKSLYSEYLALVIEASDTDNIDNLPTLLADLHTIQDRLWNMAVENVRGGDNSNATAMYAESINEMSNSLANRIAIAAQARMPTGIWAVLYALVLLGMVAVGYQTAIADSRRTWAMLLMALSFSIVIVMIAALDDTERGYFPVSQRPLTDLQASMDRKVSP